MEITLTQGIGYAGKTAGKAYIARITGIDEKYGLAREFLDAAKVERDHYNRPRYLRTYTYEITREGVYEIQESSERRYKLVFLGWSKGEDHAIVSKHLVRMDIDSDRAKAIARMMTSGQEFGAARKATKPQAA